ncbi:MAG: hypothetical protein WA369_00395 [Candidatus Acidiferrales bacterium]
MVCQKLRVSAAIALGLLLAAVRPPIHAQQIRTVVEPQARVFPSVGAGVTALKRDSAGRYYILAKPANIVSIYDGDGTKIGQIPNARSGGAVIRYAADIDLGPDGNLFVADRGANAIEIFRPDGSLVAKVSLVAPTSVVALSGGQFAVTSLTSDHLVEIIDERGKVIRSFGDPEYITEDESGKNRVIDWGKITGDSAGGVYFAFTSLPQPTLRKYDRFGYVAYETALPDNFFESAPTGPRDRVELGLNVTELGLSERTGGWISLGSSGDVKFGGGVGMGLNQIFASGGNYGRGPGQQGSWQSGFGGAPYNFGNSSLGGTVSGQVSTQGAQFHVGMGAVSGPSGGGRRGGGAGAGFSDQSATQSGGVLQFFGAGNSFASSQNGSGTEPSFTSQDLTLDANAATDVFGSLDANGNPAPTGIGLQPSFGSPGAFAAWSIFNARDFRPRGGEGPGGAGPGGPGAPGGLAAANTSASSVLDTLKDPAEHSTDSEIGIEPRARFEPHRRFGEGSTGITASARVNLGDLGPNSEEKPQITAVSVDPTTQETWAGIGDTLVGFAKDGTPIGVYYLTLPGGAPLTPSAVLVEPDRFIVAADPWGIFEFDRPGRARLVKRDATPAPQVGVQSQVASPKQ